MNIPPGQMLRSLHNYVTYKEHEAMMEGAILY